MKWNRQHTAALLIILFAFSSYTITKELVATGFTLTGKRVTGIKDDLVDNSINNLVTQFAVKEALNALELASGTNSSEFINIRAHGGFPDATIPVSGNNANGTNQTAAMNAAIAAAPKNATVFVGAGNWLFSTALTAWAAKQINLLIIGDTYHNGANFITINASGGFKQHNIVHLGTAVGRVNMPSHSKNATAGTRSSPPWSAFTGTFLTINNTDRNRAMLNRVEGFAKAVEITGGAGAGSQENTISFHLFYKNAIGISLRSLDGFSWCDKNIFTGFNGGQARVSGGLGIKIDGFPNAVTVGAGTEVYNGAFRSNKFKFLAEQLDSLCIANGDITENEFDITIEAGVNTGIMGVIAYQMRSVAPNFVRTPKYNGQGILNTIWLTNGMGIDGTIDMPIWLNNSTYIGNRAKINTTGQIIAEVRASLSKSTRDALPAGMLTVNEPEPFDFRDITAATYTPVAGDDVIRFNNAAGTFTAPPASTWVQGKLIVQNIHSANALAIANVTGLVTLPFGKSMQIICDGVTWRTVDDGGTGSGGVTPWTDNGTYITYLQKVAIGFGSAPTAYLHLKAGTATAGSAPLKIPTGTALTTPEDDAIENITGSLWFTDGVDRQQIATNTNTLTFSAKTWNGVPITPFYINGTATAGHVLQTSGTTNGTFFGENDGGFQIFRGTSSSAVSATLGTVSIPDNTSGEIEVILTGYDPAGAGKAYAEHYVQKYLKDGGTLTLKGTEGVIGSNYIIDFTPASAVGGVVTSNTYQIRIASTVAAETITWSAFAKVRAAISVAP